MNSMVLAVLNIVDISHASENDLWFLLIQLCWNQNIAAAEKKLFLFHVKFWRDQFQILLMIWKILKNLVYCSFIQTGFCFWLLKLFPILLIKIIEMAFLGGTCFSDVACSEKKKKRKEGKSGGPVPVLTLLLAPGLWGAAARGERGAALPTRERCCSEGGSAQPSPSSAWVGARPGQGEHHPEPPGGSGAPGAPRRVRLCRGVPPALRCPAGSRTVRPQPPPGWERGKH